MIVTYWLYRRHYLICYSPKQHNWRSHRGMSGCLCASFYFRCIYIISLCTKHDLSSADRLSCLQWSWWYSVSVNELRRLVQDCECKLEWFDTGIKQPARLVHTEALHDIRCQYFLSLQNPVDLLSRLGTSKRSEVSDIRSVRVCEKSSLCSSSDTTGSVLPSDGTSSRQAVFEKTCATTQKMF